MKIAVFGATGRTGIPLVKQALEAGYEVNAFVRDPAKMSIQDEKLTLIQGDVYDAAKVEEAVKGTDAVFSVLGHTSKETPPDMQTTAMQHIVAAMEKHGVARLISLTGAGVRDPRDEPKFIDKAIRLLLKFMDGKVLEDAENHAEVIRQSNLDWTIVRGPRLTEGPHTGDYRASYVGKGSGITISRADLAEFMLKQLQDDSYVRAAPMVSS
jgi:putative NADH-flavin reductase